MKKHQLILICVALCSLFFSFTSKSNNHRVKIAVRYAALPLQDREKVFLKHADEALNAIEQGAGKLSIKGVAMVMFAPGDSIKSWTSKMKVVGQMKKGISNLLGVASSKASEMADTYQDSGNGIRPPMKGEYGYQGGVIRKVSSGYIMAVFSGGSPAQDKEAATAGAELLAKYFDSK
ncbi:MAG: hypothetical protein V4592_16680 [Bacteroidota bacterium]